MANVLPHKAEQANRASRLGTAAAAVGRRCLATATLYVAQSVVGAIDKSSSSTVGTELGHIRSSMELSQAVDNDLSASRDAVTELLIQAVEEGMVSELQAAARQIKGASFEYSNDDRETAAAYPIHGHTANEISVHMHETLRYEMDGILAGPLVGDFDVRAVPQYLGDLVSRFADRTSSAVEEAYYAGVQLANRLVVEALDNAS